VCGGRERLAICNNIMTRVFLKVNRIQKKDGAMARPVIQGVSFIFP